MCVKNLFLSVCIALCGAGLAAPEAEASGAENDEPVVEIGDDWADVEGL